MRTLSPVIRLATQQRNPFTEKVARALAIKNLPFKRVVVEDPADIARWNPTSRTLPVLDIDGERRADSRVIIEWLDKIFPEPPLLARDPKTAEAQQRLAEWSDSSFSFYWDRWRMARYPLPGDEEPADQSLLERLRSGLGRTLRFSGEASRGELRELQVIDGIAKRLDDLVQFLGDRDYFHASEPSVADLAVLGMLLIIRDGPIPGAPELLAERTSLAAYLDRLEERTGGRTVVDPI